MCLVIGASGTIIVQDYLNSQKTTNTEVTTNYNEVSSLSGSVDKIYDAVVLVENYVNNNLSATGTGFIYKKNDTIAYVMTNAHVVKGATSVKVILSDTNTVDATVVGSDEYADIAVLSIDPAVVKTVATIGDSSSLKLGDTLFTVGSPLGVDYQGTVTKGILSGKDRTISVTLSNGDFIMEVLQTDAAINEGNSGGPLCNINGEVIGINSLKIVETSTEGMGFAIPIELAYSTAEKLETGNKIKRPVIGVSLVNIDNYALYKYGINTPVGVNSGSVIIQVQDNSLASLAGLKKGDVILSIDGLNVKDTAYFRYLLYKHDIGDTISIKYNSNGEEKEVKITLTESLEE